jgi:hypothetical protein
LRSRSMDSAADRSPRTNLRNALSARATSGGLLLVLGTLESVLSHGSL